MSTGASASAKRCSRPKTIFMASERPCSPPKRGIGAYGISASASVAASDSTVRPTRMQPPGSTRASSTSAAPTCTPLREPRLRICTPPSTSDSSACIQLTLPSVSTSPHAGRAPDEDRLVAELDDGAAIGALHHLDANLAQVHGQRLLVFAEVLGGDHDAFGRRCVHVNAPNQQDAGRRLRVARPAETRTITMGDAARLGTAPPHDNTN